MFGTHPAVGRIRNSAGDLAVPEGRTRHPMVQGFADTFVDVRQVRRRLKHAVIRRFVALLSFITSLSLRSFLYLTSQRHWVSMPDTKFLPGSLNCGGTREYPDELCVKMWFMTVMFTWFAMAKYSIPTGALLHCRPGLHQLQMARNSLIAGSQPQGSWFHRRYSEHKKRSRRWPCLGSMFEPNNAS